MSTRPRSLTAMWTAVYLGAALLFSSATPQCVDAAIAQQVSAGQNHTCALTDTGAVLCWGSNFEGRLGNGTGLDSAVPTGVSGLAGGALALGVGVAHSCAVDASNGIWCWGRGGAGQLGDGAAIDSNAPVAVSNLPGGVESITAGYAHSCAVTSGGGVLCWGLNDDGQLGDGTNTSSPLPVAVIGLGSGVVAVSAGDGSTCALTSTGAVLCWGSDLQGRLGNGGGGDSNVPVAVAGLASGVAAISNGSDSACAVLDSGEVRCWGSNEFGTLGDDVIASSDVPVTIAGVSSDATSVAVAYDHVCVGTASGGVQCWGRGDMGQLGDGNGTGSTVPVQTSAPSGGVVSLSALGFHTCAVATSGAIWCWGVNDTGQIGSGGTSPQSPPVQVVGFEVPAIPALEPASWLLLSGVLVGIARRRLPR